MIATDLDLIEQNADKRLAHDQIELIGGAAIITFTAELQGTAAFGRSDQEYPLSTRNCFAVVGSISAARLLVSHVKKIDADFFREGIVVGAIQFGPVSPGR